MLLKLLRERDDCVCVCLGKGRWLEGEADGTKSFCLGVLSLLDDKNFDANSFKYATFYHKRTEIEIHFFLLKVKET